VENRTKTGFPHIMWAVRRIVDALAELILGSSCPGCQTPAFGICQSCQTLLLYSRPVHASSGGIPVVAGGHYAGILREVILTAKERRGLGCLPVLSRLLARAIAEVAEPGSILVPVPTAPARIAERGIDLPLDTALGAARSLGRQGLPLRVIPALRLTRVPADQSGLGPSARADNVAHSMRWKRRPATSPVIIVDDLVTTGSTLAEAVRACATAGVQVQAAACLARPPFS
jgi:predicted amidophosphoribosyltransferase